MKVMKVGIVTKRYMKFLHINLVGKLGPYRILNYILAEESDIISHIHFKNFTLSGYSICLYTLSHISKKTLIIHPLYEDC